MGAAQVEILGTEPEELTAVVAAVGVASTKAGARQRRPLGLLDLLETRSPYGSVKGCDGTSVINTGAMPYIV